MRAAHRGAIAVVFLLIPVSAASAQFVMVPTQASFGRGRTSIFVQPRVIPVSPSGYANGPNGIGLAGLNGGFANQQGAQPPNGMRWPGARAGNGVVFPPEFDAPARQAPAKDAKLGPAPKPPVLVLPDVPRPPIPVAGRAEADRFTETGSRAFADGQFGRAHELFRKAAEITPNEPSAHFLVAQAQFARGKFREAVAAIEKGITLRGDWSEARFHPRDLYRKKPAEFDDHLDVLRQAVATHPDDSWLLFLLGHQLWFDGQLTEARGLISKSRAIGKGQTPADAFVLK